MQTIKRTGSINRNHFRKNNNLSTALKQLSKPQPKLKPIVAAIAALLVGCSSKQEAQVVSSVEDCTNNTDLTTEECEIAYQQALLESEKTAPKYQSASQCETEFGAGQCTQSSSGFFMPFMAGFLVSSLLDSSRNHYNPVYHYRGQGSNYGRILTPDGRVLGRAGDRSFKVPNDTLTQPIPSVQRTVSRGGFGSQAAAKSNWGGSSGRSGGWGG